MCKGLSALPSTCLERAKEMKVKLAHLADKQDRAPRHKEESLLQDFEKLLSSKHGVAAFRSFLRSEFSEENIEFWLACQDYSGTKSPGKLAPKAKRIYSQFVAVQAPQEVNLDSETREAVTVCVSEPTPASFSAAQQRIYTLMEKDSFPRFLKSSYCLEALRSLCGVAWQQQEE
ncbi:regulator of G-protein signaling 5-like isoform X2 [Polyodon spathula]|uniref:regulator of G-protein signaling 5-like isoform X2 n=1 Tax=Polyodon spathula TaxID=7913 RepID=UPI001B7E43C1|nr:regulator of G-protein signaling 5-like isoform X2 [Polyodon spathula]